VGAEHDYSPQLEKLLLKGKGGGPRQRRILEINSKHPIFELMTRRFRERADDPALADFAQLLFGQALLTEGSELPDPVKFSQKVAELMVASLSGSASSRTE
jgi:molecular chaperone HtpG